MNNAPGQPAATIGHSYEGTVGLYANFCGVAINPDEVVFTFGQQVPETSGLVVPVKIYVSVSHAKRIAGMLDEAIARYEALFGYVEVDPAKRLTEEGKLVFQQANDGKGAEGGSEDP